MMKRDLVVVLVGLLVVCIGILCALLDYTTLALIALLILGLLVLSLITLQRRQLGILQRRTLEILRSVNTFESMPTEAKESLRNSEAEVGIHISTKKIIGILHAQHIQIEELSNKLTELLEQNEDFKKFNQDSKI